ncbi:MAG TPA: sensor histidine kinase [Brevundimonas sp.]|uniref:sensor histidine kinase n=1 Tax=Brevundimonas sp. TaxID=1871086 RepID=UPI002E123F6E|nr:sensor histidine kinase [Brevundimonas sp.]
MIRLPAGLRWPVGVVRPGRSLTLRLIWLATAWIAAALVLTGYVLTSQFQESGLRRLSGVLNTTLDALVVASARAPDVAQTPQIMDQRTLDIFSGKYWTIAVPDGEGGLRPVARSRSLWDSDLYIPAGLYERLEASPGAVITYNDIGPNDEPVRVAATLKEIASRGDRVVYLAAIDRSNIDIDTAQFARLTWTALGLLGVGLIAAVLFQVRIGLRPLYDLQTEIADVRKGKAARVQRPYPREIQPLAEQVNRLLEHNHEVVERQRTHVGNLAHALKTPLSVLLAEVNGREGALPDLVRRQTDVMKNQVDHHLRRARAAARAQSSGERTSVPEVLDELAVMIERVLQDKNLEIDWRAPEDLCFRGERQDLQEILGNLIENAGKWSRRRVRVVAGPAGLGRLVVVVEDDGRGVPEAQRAEILRRGARADEATPGSGLGLAIVDELTRAYGGRLTLAESELGGLKAVLELPAAEA